MKITVGAAINLQADPGFQTANDSYRNQWNSTRLLCWFLNKFNPSREKKILGILDLDAYSNG
jgi:archaemetzincin